VFFDALGIKWEYEKEGYDLGPAGWYLPDFWLPEQQCWVEIKATFPNGVDTEKLLAFGTALETNRDEDGERTGYLHIYVGSPYFDGKQPSYDIMRVSSPCGLRTVADIRTSGMLWTQCPLCGHFDVSYFNLCFSDEGTEAVGCMHCDCVDRNWKETTETWFYKGYVVTRYCGFILGSPRLRAAYTAARSARFEHGESG